MDPIFEQEQEHLSCTYAQLEEIERETRERLEARLGDALDKHQDMLEALTLDFSGEVNVETYVEIEALHKIIDEYNLAQDLDTERLAAARLLLKQPYFAKLQLQFKPGEEPRDVYIGSTGITDDMSRRLVVDWRSPVAEVYYNQANGHTSYEAAGRVIECDLLLRRQFDIERDVLNAYFDTTVAIEDPLLLASLSRERSDRLTDITATIQAEQNVVIRHSDVPALLVRGVAGSGKTSVLLQRIAYLLYQQRDNLKPEDVYLITPNPVFERYIANVLPSMGEHNPQTLTWDELMGELGFDDRGLGSDPSGESLKRIDDELGRFKLDSKDFRDICIEDEHIITAQQARNAWEKFGKFETGSKRSALVVEELRERLEQRIARLSRDEDMQGVVTEMTPEEQIRIFGQYVTADDEEEIVAATKDYLETRYAGVEERIEQGEWLRLERVGMRLLGVESLTSAELAYLRLALVGAGARGARYCMIDEVQDYTVPQLMVLARYYAGAHFLLLGDPNQAIRPHTASFEQVKEVFERACGSVEECLLMTSYRSSPEITALFTKLMDEGERAQVSSVQRPGTEPLLRSCADADELEAALREAAAEAARHEGITAIIAADAGRARQAAKVLDGLDVTVLERDGRLPAQGVVLCDVALAKGLEFDGVIIADAQHFAHEHVGRHRLYTALSRATKRLTVLTVGELPL